MTKIVSIPGPTLFEAPTEADRLAAMQPGQRLQRGVARHLRQIGFACLEEFVPERSLRVDVMALGPKGELWIVECKSCRADFLSDGKWQNYLPFCDRFFWAVDCDFPQDLLPGESGLIVADAYDAEVIRMAPELKLAAARRQKLVRDFARCAANRWAGAVDPRI